MMFDRVPKNELYGWLVVTGLILLLRALGGWAFYRSTPVDTAMMRWRYLYVVGVAMTGCLWGYGAFSFTFSANAMTILQVVVFVTGLSAVISLLYSQSFCTAAAFLSTALLPLVLRLVLGAGLVELILGVITAFNLVVLLAISRYGRKILTHVVWWSEGLSRSANQGNISNVRVACPTSPQQDSRIARDVSQRTVVEQEEVQAIMLQRIRLEKETERQASEERFCKLIESLPNAIMRLDAEGRLLHVSPAVLELFGQTPVQWPGKTLVEAALTGDAWADQNLYDLVLKVIGSGEREVAVVECRAHMRRSVEVLCIPETNIAGKSDGVIGILRDCTERTRIEDALRLVGRHDWSQHDEPFHAVLARHLGQSLDMDYVVLARLLDGHTAVETVALYAKGEVLPNMSYSLKGTPCENIISGGLCCYPEDIQQHFPDDSMLVKMEVESYIGLPLWDSRGEVVGLMAVMDGKPIHNDALVKNMLQLTSTRASMELERERSEQVLRQQASYDTLTGLPNRWLLLRRLEEEVARARRKSSQVALLFVNLDHFKEVNDSFGHHAGDRLLAETARRIQSRMRQSDIVTRLGGDEFVVIVPDLREVEYLGGIAQSINDRITQPVRLKGQSDICVTASIGIACYPQDADNTSNLLSHANQAMCSAKKQGRNSYCFFTKSMQTQSEERLRLVRDLRNALPQGQLEVHFQPIVESATGRIVKAEALLRWKHPERDNVPPDQFIPVAEDSGLIHDIGDWVFREVVKTALKFRSRSQLGDIQWSVNLSPRQFLHKGMSDTLIGYLDQVDLPPSCVVIEITEGLLLEDRPEILSKLRKLRRAGMKVALDDFGTGYSAMSYLKKFDIDYLKIDQSFVRDIAVDDTDRALAETIVIMARRLGINAIAEGVETEEQHHILAAAGCHYMQGYFYAKPMPPNEVLQFVLDRESESLGAEEWQGGSNAILQGNSC